jgi:hypothetical protein
MLKLNTQCELGLCRTFKRWLDHEGSALMNGWVSSVGLLLSLCSHPVTSCVTVGLYSHHWKEESPDVALNMGPPSRTEPNKLFFFFLFLLVIGLELRASCSALGPALV